MTLRHLTKIWTWAVLVGVLSMLAWAYATAHAHRSVPAHHPWPAISLIAGAFGALLIGAGASRSRSIAALVTTLFVAASAVLYAASAL